jgi:hypothetical protein
MRFVDVATRGTTTLNPIVAIMAKTVAVSSMRLSISLYAEFIML